MVTNTWYARMLANREAYLAIPENIRIELMAIADGPLTAKNSVWQSELQSISTRSGISYAALNMCLTYYCDSWYNTEAVSIFANRDLLEAGDGLCYGIQNPAFLFPKGSIQVGMFTRTSFVIIPHEHLTKVPQTQDQYEELVCQIQAALLRMRVLDITGEEALKLGSRTVTPKVA